MAKGYVTQPHQMFLRPVDLRQISKKQTSKNRRRSLCVTRKPSGILALLLCKQFLRVFPWSCEPLGDEFPAVMSHVCLALQEHKLNFQQWSSALLVSCFEAISLIFDRAMTYLSGLLVSL